MKTTETIPANYRDAIATLVEWQSNSAYDDLEIYVIDDPSQTQVRLLETSDGFPETGRVDAYPMGRSDEFPFQSAVALIHRDELPRIREGKIALPAGWNLSSMHLAWSATNGWGD